MHTGRYYVRTKKYQPGRVIMRFVLSAPTSGITRAAAILVGALMAFAGWSKACAQMPKELGGCWQTTRALQTSNPQSLRPAEARAFLGTKLRFTPSLAPSAHALLNPPHSYVNLL